MLKLLKLFTNHAKSLLIDTHKCVHQEAWVLVPDLAWVGYKAQSATDFLEHGVHFFTADQLVQWAGLMWGIWNARNKRIFENICLEPNEVVKRSKDLCTDFSTSKLQLRLSIPSPVSECVWKKPDIGWRKLNCDASFNVDVHSGCGFIIRDSCGSVELLGSCGIGVVPDAEYAGAIAIREGIQCAVSRGMNRLVVESDSLSLISKLRSHRPWKGPLGRQLNAIRKLGTRIAELRWSHTRRDGNRVAHSLARLGLNQYVVSLVVAMFPDVVQSLIVTDLQ